MSHFFQDSWARGTPARLDVRALEYVDAINRIRSPFNVNAPASAAGIAAIEDTAHVARSVAHNDKWLHWLTTEIGRLGLTVTPSAANFILIHFPRAPGRTAAEADEASTAQGVILRQVGAYGLPHALRMSVGTEEANRLAVATLAQFMARSGRGPGSAVRLKSCRRPKARRWLKRCSTGSP